MSDAEDRDLLAAEYVLGVLDAAEAKRVEQMVADDPGFARAMRAWEERLAPLSTLADPIEPPAAVWQRIATATTLPDGAVVPLRRLRIWQLATAGGLALAAALAAFIVLRPPPPPLVAVLTPAGNAAPVLLATREPGGRLRVRPNGTITVPDGRDLELWLLRAGETVPHSLGVLAAGGQLVSAARAPGAQLLVSLEPKGGSPTGSPTGPVLYAGRLSQLD
jgi:anti-sigma-K factor RskA